MRWRSALAGVIDLSFADFSVAIPQMLSGTLRGVGVMVSPMQPAEFGEFIRSEIVRWSTEAKAAGIEPQ